MTVQTLSRRLVASTVSVLVILLASCGVAPREDLARSARPAAGRDEAPHAISEPDGTVLVAWGSVDEDGRADILVSRWGEAPVRVNPTPSTAVAGRQVGPRIARLASGRLLVSWVGRGADSAGDILLSASDDGGRRFSPPLRVNDDPIGAGQEYQDLAVLPGDRVALVWLDERNAPSDKPNQKQVYFAESSDGGKTFGRNRPLTVSPDGVCTCCRPGIAAEADGTIHVVYRDRSGAELFIRELTLRPGDPAPAAPVTVSTGGWRFQACPTDAPSIRVGPAGSIHVGWMDGTSGEPALWRAESRDGGRSFSSPAPLESSPSVQLSLASSGAGLAIPEAGALACCVLGEPHAQPGRAAWAHDPRWGFAAAWETSDGRVRCALSASPSSESVSVDAPEGTSAQSPQLISTPDGFVVIWVETRWREPPGGGAPRLEGRLRRAQLKVSEGAITLSP